jgi:hypothetical protein
MRWLVLTLLLSSCGLTGLNPFSGGGTNVAANTQVGQENYQGVTTNVDRSVKPVLRPEGPVDTVQQDNSVTNISEISPLLLILLVLGWLAPSPQEMGRGLLNLIATMRRGRNGSETK